MRISRSASVVVSSIEMPNECGPSARKLQSAFSARSRMSWLDILPTSIRMVSKNALCAISNPSWRKPDASLEAKEWTRLAIERSQAELAVAKREYKPDFSFQGGYLLMPGQTDSLLVRVGMTWPTAPWVRGRLDAKVAEATANVEAATAGQQSAENALRFAVQEAYLRAKAAEQRPLYKQTQSSNPALPAYPCSNCRL